MRIRHDRTRPLIALAALAIGLLCNPNAGAFGPATHLYIAQHVFHTAPPQMLFGAMAADMSWFEWSHRQLRNELKRLTHEDSELLPMTPLRFGLVTHNRAWGADAYAHAYAHPNPDKPFPALIVARFSQETGMTLGDAEDFLELAMEYVIRMGWGPSLSGVIASCADSVGDAEEQALVDAWAGPLASRVHGVSLETAAETIRQAFRMDRAFLRVYGAILAYDDDALEAIMPEVLSLVFKIDVPTARDRLARAVVLLEDWRGELDRIAAALRERIGVMSAPERFDWRGMLLVIAAYVIL